MGIWVSQHPYAHFIWPEGAKPFYSFTFLLFYF